MKKKLGVAKIEEIKCYRFFGEDGRIDRLDFIPVDNAPGFSHRGAFNGELTKKWFGMEFRLNQKNALDMLDLVRKEKEGR